MWEVWYGKGGGGEGIPTPKGIIGTDEPTPSIFECIGDGEVCVVMVYWKSIGVMLDDGVDVMLISVVGVTVIGGMGRLGNIEGG